MKIELPKGKMKPTRISPKTMVIYSKPKSGKTSIAAALEGNLIVDFEDGAEFTDGARFNVMMKAKEENTSVLSVIKDLVEQIKVANKEKGSYVYKYITLDTVTALEDISLELANIMYRNTVQGKNWEGKDVRDLANGAGWRWMRSALTRLINEFQGLSETLIIFGHVKDKHVELEGELPEKALALAGKMSSILCSQVDIVGYMYRDGMESIINFKPSENLIAGGRVKHLEGEKIVIATTQPDKSVKVEWNKIFIN